MSVINKYERAFERIEQEKVAEYLVDSYGTNDGYLPSNYADAFVQLEKEAHVQNLVDVFAPDTQYIPSAYVSILEKEANFLASLGTGMKNTAKNMMGKVKSTKQVVAPLKEGVQGPPRMVKGLGDKATLGDTARFYGSKALGAASKNPGAAVAGVGAAGLGGAYMMSGRGNNNG